MDVPRPALDDDVSFNIASSDLVLIPILLSLKPPKSETQPIATIQSPNTLSYSTSSQRTGNFGRSVFPTSKVPNMMTLLPS